MNKLAIAFVFALTAPAFAAEPDGLILPPGFHASVVAESVGPARHIAVRGNGDLYISTRNGREATTPLGIIALKLDRDHKVIDTQHFGMVEGGTGVRFYKDALYAASPTG